MEKTKEELCPEGRSVVRTFQLAQSAVKLKVLFGDKSLAFSPPPSTKIGHLHAAAMQFPSLFLLLYYGVLGTAHDVSMLI